MFFGLKIIVLIAVKMFEVSETVYENFQKFKYSTINAVMLEKYGKT